MPEAGPFISSCNSSPVVGVEPPTNHPWSGQDWKLTPVLPFAKLMNYSRIRSWILPMLATLAWIPLLVHQSEPAVLFGRYSLQYAIMLILYGLNLVLFWRKSVRRVLYQRLKEQLSPGPLISLALVAVSAVFLIDFGIGIGLQLNPPIWVTIVLLGVLLLQVKALRGQLTFALSHLALITCSVVLAVVLLESIFVLFLLESRTPKNQREFLRLMTSSEIRKHNSGWSQPISVPKPPGTFRILGLADSFGTFGGITTNYHYLLEGILRRDVSPRIQMINLSVPGYNPLRDLVILRRFGMDIAQILSYIALMRGTILALATTTYISIGVSP
jgi:hypothetical protein